MKIERKIVNSLEYFAHLREGWEGYGEMFSIPKGKNRGVYHRMKRVVK